MFFIPRAFALMRVLGILGAVCTTLAIADEAAVSTDQPKSKDAVGSPVASWCVKQAVKEIKEGLKTRDIEQRLSTWLTYISGRLDSTAGQAHTSEITGNCRLTWYDHLMRHPLEAPIEAERFTRELHQALRDDHRGLDRALIMIREKLDAGPREPLPETDIESAEQAIDTVKQSLDKAHKAFTAAIAPLSAKEQELLRREIYPVLTSQGCIGHTLLNRPMGRTICDLLEKMDRRALLDAADALVPLSDPQVLERLSKVPEQGSLTLEGVRGSILQIIDTPAGKLVIGGRGDNVYELDKTPNVCGVIDLGGNDAYYEGTLSRERPVLVVIDLAGNDRYIGTQPGIQGGAMLGVSMLVDAAGDDVYDARDIAQGSAVGGVGILIDRAGNDRYQGVRRVQGQALAGVGLLLDRSGADDYHAAMWAQGFGGPLGFGVLDDLDGNDHYYCGGMWRTSYYPDTPGYEGWGQGIGAGIRSVADGGIGVILDGNGDDVYEYDYFAQGGGYWLGLGFARDFAGDDTRLGSTQKAYNGSRRTQSIFDRFDCGFGCHFAMGFCFDDAGNDTYGGTIMGLGFGWDCSNGFLFDFGGNDRLNARGGQTEGAGAQASLGVLFNYGGDDVYEGDYEGYASPGISYHPLPRCGGNFSFLIDYGGDDTYGCGAKNNSYIQRGSLGGFLVDRRLEEEESSLAAQSAKMSPAAAAPHANTIH